MTNHNQSFLDQLATFPANTFENRFSSVVSRLGVASVFDRNELSLLFEAAYRATHCNIAFNDRAPKGGIPASDERHRNRLEVDYMVARDVLFASPGWQALSRADQVVLSRIFLTVLVAPQKLSA